MTNSVARRPARTHCGRVLAVRRLTPHLTRVLLGGAGLAGFTAGPHTDMYVKLLFPAAGTEPDLSDPAAARARLPRELWPRTRTYTVRSWDPARGELAIDFALHGGGGIAGPWAASVVPGALLHFTGPGGAYTPDPDADWHLLAGDDSALPAIAASLAALPARAVAKVFIEVEGPRDELALDGPAGAEVVWLHRGARTVGELLVERIGAFEPPAGRADVFAHGEAHFVKALRRDLRARLGGRAGRMSVSGYWRLGADEDGWQSSKAAWNAQADRELLISAGTGGAR
jgi:NADPH-dependent ferric siderophore reductase